MRKWNWLWNLSMNFAKVNVDLCTTPQLYISIRKKSTASDTNPNSGHPLKLIVYNLELMWFSMKIYVASLLIVSTMWTTFHNTPKQFIRQTMLMHLLHREHGTLRPSRIEHRCYCILAELIWINGWVRSSMAIKITENVYFSTMNFIS